MPLSRFHSRQSKRTYVSTHNRCEHHITIICSVRYFKHFHSIKTIGFFKIFYVAYFAHLISFISILYIIAINTKYPHRQWFIYAPSNIDVYATYLLLSAAFYFCGFLKPFAFSNIRNFSH